MNPESIQPTLERVSAWFSHRFAQLDLFSSEIIAALRFDAEDRVELGEAMRRRMKAIAARYLAENATVDGCGLIFAHSALGTQNGHLEWWVREDDTRFARYSFGVVPGADRYYDYEHHEWFIRAFNEGTPALVGPYIDYLGVEAYVLTITVPAEVRGVRVGAVGNDLQLADVEAELLPILLQAPVTAILVGRLGNVLLSNSSRYLPGELVAATPEGFAEAPVEPASTGLRIIYEARSHA